VIVPHGPLHFLPFHALRQSGKYLATIHYFVRAERDDFCAMPAERGQCEFAPVVFGVADQNAPEIDAEVKAVAEILPGSELLAGEKATVAALRDRGATVGILHVATARRCTAG